MNNYNNKTNDEDEDEIEPPIDQTENNDLFDKETRKDAHRENPKDPDAYEMKI